MSTSDMIRVMIVDDHDMVRRGLATILKITADLQLVGEASNGQEAVPVCMQVQPDVILMDLVMPEMDGADATRMIREHCPHIQVLALTSFMEKELVERALEAGAIGYLLKNVSAGELADAIRAAHDGRPTLAPEVAQTLIQAEKLEHLAREIIDAPPDASALPELLSAHVPMMFPGSRIEIRLSSDQSLLRHPAAWPAVPEPMWAWLRTTSEAQCFLPGVALPWGGIQPASEGLVIAPITDIEGRQPIGGVYVSRERNPGAVADLLPTVRSLAAEIASALHSAEVYAQTLAHRKVERELAMAGQIQASLLPSKAPDVTGWQIAARLEPARETSGDFYDFIPLPNGLWGIVIADVADKGMGAAIYMALSRTLIRTYAAEFPTRPELVLSTASRRILTDARGGLFVTVFYGVLDPMLGTLRYCNAGHNPPFILSDQDGEKTHVLGKTGMALGVVEDEKWKQASVKFAPGDVLLLYTDGIIEAQDARGELFGKQRLRETLLACVRSGSTGRRPAQDIQDALVAEVRRFIGQAPQSDDMTLVTVVREA
jgi:serine phosphatase RsbU (regulator of sigma subunit)/DNA-binding NarL/FixJ family response regulator